MQYIKGGGTVPVPFNIIPTPKSVINLFRKIANCFKKKEKKPVVEETLPPAKPGRGNPKTPDQLPIVNYFNFKSLFCLLSYLLFIKKIAFTPEN